MNMRSYTTGTSHKTTCVLLCIGHSWIQGLALGHTVVILEHIKLKTWISRDMINATRSIFSRHLKCCHAERE